MRVENTRLSKRTVSQSDMDEPRRINQKEINKNKQVVG